VHVVHIPKNHLMLIAGLVWCAAGAMVCMIGLPLEFGLAPSHLILFPLAVVIFLVFYFFVFSRLVRSPSSTAGSAWRSSSAAFASWASSRARTC
jgi:hypothetical protein